MVKLDLIFNVAVAERVSEVVLTKIAMSSTYSRIVTEAAKTFLPNYIPTRPLPPGHCDSTAIFLASEGTAEFLQCTAEMLLLAGIAGVFVLFKKILRHFVIFTKNCDFS